MGSSIIGLQRDAITKFQTPFPFFMENGGLGATLTCTGTSSRTLFVGAGQTLLIHNFGAAPVFLAWGEAAVVATINHLPVLPGPIPTLFTLPADDRPDVLTYFAGITEGATCRVLVHRGSGC